MISGFDETCGTCEEILASARASRAAECSTGAVQPAEAETEAAKAAAASGEAAQARMEEILLNYPVCEYAFGDTEEIPFSDKVLTICEHDCQRFGHCWACPPNAGSIQENMKKVASYRHFLLFSTMNEVADSAIFDQCMEAKRPHEELTRDLRTQLQEEWNSRFYVLSAGCMICDQCACPTEPCRYPEQRLMTTESHGIVLMQLVDKMGMEVFNGGNIIPYYSMILFD